jgi:hypothetical protein
MKALSVSLAVVALVLAGCDTLSDARDSVREMMAARDEGRTKTYHATSRATYEAVRVAAGQMGYRFLRGGAAQGEFEAVSGLSANDSLRSARQIAMKVKLHADSETTTDLTVHFTEIIESDSSPSRNGIATEAPLRDTPQYEVFLRAVQTALDAHK